MYLKNDLIFKIHKECIHSKGKKTTIFSQNRKKSQIDNFTKEDMRVIDI